MDLAWRPIYAVWEITLQCDLACRHCGSRAGRARPDELTTEQALDLVRQMADLGVKEVTLIGGEAYLRDDWAQLVREIRERGMLCSITTGGRAFTPERAAAAKQAGVQAVSVSIDGVRETHDRVRALTGSFDAAMVSIRNLRDAGIPAMPRNTQINRLNIMEPEAVFDVLPSSTARARGSRRDHATAMGRAPVTERRDLGFSSPTRCSI